MPKKLAHRLAPLIILPILMMSMQSQAGFKRYTANLTQASTAAPVATVFENDFSTEATLTWARTSAGLYTLTASKPIFTASKTQVLFSGINGNILVALTSTTVITITVKDTGTNAAAAVADDVLSAVGIEIRVWN